VLFASDHWSPKSMGQRAPAGRGAVSFVGIAQPWLRDAAKSYCRFRLGTGSAWSTVAAAADCLRRLSSYMAAISPEDPGPELLSRGLIERYRSWLALSGYSTSTRSSSLIFLRSFLEANRRFGWCSGLPEGAAVYQDDLPSRDKAAPRWITEFVMAQLEDPTALEALEPTIRHLVILIMESGLRAGDACSLPFNPIVPDSSGWPCLRYWSRKTSIEQVVPLSERAAAAITDQQAFVNTLWPRGSEWLFPSPASFSAQPEPITYSTLGRQLRSWCARIGLRDEAGVPVSVTAHQFRHTLGTRLINSGVPTHIVQRILGHASVGMTEVYARLHDDTVRSAFDTYQTKRVDIAGAVLNYDASSPTADAEWLKHNLAKISASLPNGYCGRPPQQECPHPNACLTCPAFQTTVEFLPVHRQHLKANARLIKMAESKGQDRLVENHRRIQEALERIIPSLEGLDGDAGEALSEQPDPDE